MESLGGAQEWRDGVTTMTWVVEMTGEVDGDGDTTVRSGKELRVQHGVGVRDKAVGFEAQIGLRGFPIVDGRGLRPYDSLR